MTSVKTRWPFISIRSKFCSKCKLSFGLKTMKSVPIINGIKMSILVSHTITNQRRLKCKLLATIAFGGLPTNVPIPPILALYAIPNNTKT